jgi:hypothetical protein
LILGQGHSTSACGFLGVAYTKKLWELEFSVIFKEIWLRQLKAFCC